MVPAGGIPAGSREIAPQGGNRILIVSQDLSHQQFPEFCIRFVGHVGHHHVSQLMIEQPLEPFVGRDDAESKTVRFYPQYHLVIGHGYGSAVTGIFKISQKHVGGGIPIRPEFAVKIHGVQVRLVHMRNQVSIAVPEIDQVQVVFFHAVDQLCMQNPGQARDNDSQE